MRLIGCITLVAVLASSCIFGGDDGVDNDWLDYDPSNAADPFGLETASGEKMLEHLAARYVDVVKLGCKKKYATRDWKVACEGPKQVRLPQRNDCMKYLLGHYLRFRHSSNASDFDFRSEYLLELEPPAQCNWVSGSGEGEPITTVISQLLADACTVELGVYVGITGHSDSDYEGSQMSLEPLPPEPDLTAACASRINLVSIDSGCERALVLGRSGVSLMVPPRNGPWESQYYYYCGGR